MTTAPRHPPSSSCLRDARKGPSRGGPGRRQRMGEGSLANRALKHGIARGAGRCKSCTGTCPASLAHLDRRSLKALIEGWPQLVRAALLCHILRTATCAAASHGQAGGALFYRYGRAFTPRVHEPRMDQPSQGLPGSGTWMLRSSWRSCSRGASWSFVTHRVDR